MGTKVAVLVSGGIDSNILLATLLRRFRQVYPIYVRFGFIWEKTEIYWLKRFLKRISRSRLQHLALLDLPITDLDKSSWAVTGRGTLGYHSADEEVYLIGRNLLLLSKAVTFCATKKIPLIAIGSLSGNPFPDATRKFFDHFGKTASLAVGRPIRVIAPFLRLKKREILKKGKGLPLHLSFSCLKPNGLQPCRRCNKCAERDFLKG